MLINLLIWAVNMVGTHVIVYHSASSHLSISLVLSCSTALLVRALASRGLFSVCLRPRHLRSSVWALSTIAITRLLLSLQKRFHNHHVAALETCDDNNDSPDTDSTCWPRVPSVVGSPLEDPFYAYYTAPFPMVPEIQLSTRRYSSRSSKRRTVTSTQSARSILNARPGDGQDGNDEHEGMSIASNTWTPRTNDVLLVPPIPFITPLPPIPDV